MSNATYQHKCSECGSEYDRTTSWIDPTLFSDPEKATKLDTFWCPNCQQGQSIDLQMLPNNEVVEVGRKDYRLIMAEDSPRKQIFKGEEMVQKVTEELSLQVIAQSSD